MDSIFGILIIFFLFLAFSGLFYLLAKKGVFSPNKKVSGKGNYDVKNLKQLNILIKDNEDLLKQIKFLEDKNKRLKQKIKELKEVIAELKEQKDQLEKSEKTLIELRIQKDEALAVVAHDIKNPAATIKNFVELLESYDLSMQEQKEVFSGLIETSTRLMNLTNEFTQVVAEEFSSVKLSKNKHNLLSIVESIVKVNRVNAKNKNIELRLYQPSTEIMVNIDAEKMKEVVDNFISNAIKFCPPNSKVDVITEVGKKIVKVEIADNGYGLTESEIEVAFDKGTKFAKNNSQSTNSTGLGLWIAKKIVEEHNGKVWVKSKKGLGATFAFTLPVD